MKKFLSILIIAAVAMASGFVLSVDNAEAVPSYARQTQQPCFACHYQYFPKLNAMGRAFKLGGFTDTSREPIGDNLVLDISPFSFVVKAIFKKTDTSGYTGVETGSERGDWIVPDEVEAFFSGRINDKWGGQLVLPFSDKAGGPDEDQARAFADAGKLIFSDSYNSIQYGGTMFWTGGAGPFYAMELWNTGVQRSQRSWENRDATSAAQKSRVAAGEAMGFSLFAANELAFGMVGPWVPKSRMAGGETDVGDDFGIFYRAALTPSYNGWDFMLGVFGTGGTSKMDNDGNKTLETVKTRAVGIDAQAQGSYNGVSIEVLFNSVLDTADRGTTASGTNYPTNYDAQGYGGGVDVGFMEDLVGLKVFASTYDKSGYTDDDTYFSIGGWWNIYQDIKLQPEVSFQSDKDTNKEVNSDFRLTLFTAF